MVGYENPNDNRETNGDYAGRGEAVSDNDEASAIFPCDTCGQTFNEAGQLARHKSRMHTTEKPFACPDCDVKFTRKPNVKRHRKRFHNYASDDDIASTSREDTASTSREDIASTLRDDSTSTSSDVQRSVSPTDESPKPLTLGPGGIKAFQEKYEFARPPSPPSPPGSGLANNSSNRLVPPTDEELLASERRHFERHVPRGTVGEDFVRMRSDWHQRLAILHLKEGTKAMRRLYRVYGADENPDEE